MKMSLKKTHPFIALELYAGRLLRLLLKKKKKETRERQQQETTRKNETDFKIDRRDGMGGTVGYTVSHGQWRHGRRSCLHYCVIPHTPHLSLSRLLLLSLFEQAKLCASTKSKQIPRLRIHPLATVSILWRRVDICQSRYLSHSIGHEHAALDFISVSKSALVLGHFCGRIHLTRNREDKRRILGKKKKMAKLRFHSRS